RRIGDRQQHSVLHAHRRTGLARLSSLPLAAIRLLARLLRDRVGLGHMALADDLSFWAQLSRPSIAWPRTFSCLRDGGSTDLDLASRSRPIRLGCGNLPRDAQ